ncbi:MAG TPA: acyl carrier protein [Methylomirabilota bacterium]
MSAFDQLRDTMAASLGVTPDLILENTRQKDLPKWDSLAHINLMVALESNFDVSLEVEDFAALTSVPAILNYLRSRGIE